MNLPDFCMNEPESLCLLDIKVLGVAPKHEERDGTEPDIALEAFEPRDLVGTATRERVIFLYELGIAWVVLLFVGRNHLDVGMQVVVGEEGTQVVSSLHHHQVVVIERPVREVDVPAAVILVVELQFVLVFAAEDAGGHRAGAIHKVRNGVVHKIFNWFR